MPQQSKKQNSFSSIISMFKGQIRVILVHIINLVTNILVNDFAPSIIRSFFLIILGAKFGTDTVIQGGGYLYRGGLVTGKDCLVNQGYYFDVAETIFLEDNFVTDNKVTFISAEHKSGVFTPKHKIASIVFREYSS